MLLAVVGFIVAAPAAYAAAPITVDVLYNGSAVADGQVIPENSDLTFRVQYDAKGDVDIAGQEIVITLPDNVTIPSVPEGNEAIESVTQNEDGTVTIKFKDEIPSNVTEGVWALDLKISSVEENTTTPIEWTIGEDSGGVTFTTENQVTPPTEIADGYSKGVDKNNLNGYVIVEQDETDGHYYFAGLNDNAENGIQNETLTYTLVLNSADARDGYPISDVLPAGLGYVDGSFAGALTTYNPEESEDFAFAPTVTGQEFTGNVTVPENSSLTITYQVKVTDIAAIEDLLQDAFDELNGAPGNFSTTLTNTASFDDDAERTANVGFTGNVPGVGVGNAFAKDGSWNQLEVIADEDGNLENPAEMTYTLKADLTQWDGRNSNFELNHNVVIEDVLIDNAEWLTGDSEFITASGISLTQADDCPTVEEFAGDDYVGTWCVDGQTLRINVGQDTSVTAEIQAKAQLNSVAGLEQSGSTTIVGATSYKWPNSASFYYRDGGPHTDGFDGYPIVLPDDREGGLNDSATFAKEGPSGEVRVDQNEAQELPYTFKINTAKAGVNAESLKIIDEVDPELFDVDNLTSSPIEGTYDGQALGQDDFALSINDDGFLEIELSEAGKAKVADNPGKQLNIVLTLTTIVLEGKTTLEVHNKASLLGTGDEVDYWFDHDVEVTSYGDEAELRKRVFNSAEKDWVTNLDAEISDGEYIDSAFIYSVELIPRGNYGSGVPVSIFTREDVLPDNVDFLGFVELDEEGTPVLDNPELSERYMNGNVIATQEDGIVTISQMPGTNLNVNDGRIIVYYAVEPNSTDGDIVNSIAGSSTTIHPYGDPSIDIEKWNDEGAAPEYDEAGALLNDGFDGDFDTAPGKPLTVGEDLEINFTISNDGKEDLTDVVVSDQLTDGEGEIENLECVFPDGSTGTEWAGPFVIGEQFDCTGTLPGLTNGDTHSNLAQVTAVGETTKVPTEDEDEWFGWVPTPSIDIEKWNDEGAVPEYDQTGALLNDGFDGDFDVAPGKPLAADTDLPINFTISNDGEEDLRDIVVSDQLTDGSGEIADLLCTFPDGSTGTEWEGNFLVGTQFDCTGTLPGLTNGDTHANLADVTGVGIHSGTDVDDQDEWFGWVPTPSIDIEKWNNEGETPEYVDITGALENDGFDGDFDEAPGKPMRANEPLQINFTISNDGQEDLQNIVVSDALTDGAGEITDLVCVFPDESTGTEWEGNFQVGTQFDCTGTLPELTNGDTHADLATVTGVGIYSGTDVEDEDEWFGWVPTPSIDIEKWSDEGDAPEYDESGALLNDGFDGDFDEAPGKTLNPEKDQAINFTVSNDGNEPLIGLVVSDKVIEGEGAITDLVCVFPDGSEGLTWDGPFEVGEQFDCSGTLPALGFDKVHVDTASVSAIGLYSGTSIEDADDWNANTPEEVIVPGILGKAAGLAATGSNPGPFIGLAALLLLIGGAGTVIAARRNRTDV